MPDWWKVVDENWRDLQNLIKKYHPAKECALPKAVNAYLVKDYDILSAIFSSVWCSLPLDVSREPGYWKLCYLIENI